MLPVVPWTARAQQAPARTYRVALVSIGTDPKAFPGRWQTFFDAMRELGYVEERNLVVGRYFADGMANRLPGLVADLADRKSTRLNSSHIQKSRMPSSA